MHNRPATDLEAHINELYRLTTKIEICTGEIKKELRKLNKIEKEEYNEDLWAISYEDWIQNKGFLSGPYHSQQEALEQIGEMKQRIFNITSGRIAMTHRWNPKDNCWAKVRKTT